MELLHLIKTQEENLFMHSNIFIIFQNIMLNQSEVNLFDNITIEK